MCGIAGFYGFKDDSLIRKISKELEHRGPDGEGYFTSQTVTLLNRRLAIIDRKGGDQPIYNEDRSLVLVFVGEIYNFQEERKELLKAGHTFRTHSDTEVVVHAYEEWGEKSFDRHNGMFTIALYDTKKDTLILARDHFGIKPLYYAFPHIGRQKNSSANTRLMFSSEIKPLIQSGLIEKKPNDRILYRYLRYRIHDDQEETFFAGVHRLMPGEMLIVEKGRVQKRMYTRLREELEAMPEEAHLTEAHIKKFSSLLTEAITMRLMSEVPVGTCLSGGLDSSTVVTVVNKLLTEKVEEASSVGKIQNTFSAVFPGSSNDEERYIDDVLKRVKNVKSHKVRPTADEFFDRDLTNFIKTQEEPLVSSGHYAQYKVMEEAHKKVTVLLDGQGSDEMLAGYLPYYFVYLRQLKKEGNYFVLVREMIRSLDVLFKYGRIKLLRALGKNEIAVTQVLSPSFLAAFTAETYRSTTDDLKKRLLEDIFQNSVPCLLRYEDRNAMRFSIEGRVPFLDFNLLRYIFSLPDEAIIKGGWNKYILRKAVNDLLPASIVERRNKIGFTTPEEEWFMRMKNRIYSIFLSDSFAKRPYFNQPAVLSAFQAFIEGKNDDTLLFWRLLNVELWLRIFFDPPFKEASEMGETKGYFDANPGKSLERKVGKTRYIRIPLRTRLFQKGDDIPKEVTRYVQEFFAKLRKSSLADKLKGKKWQVVVTEKIVAIAQGRSFFIGEIKTGAFARFLSRYVMKTPAGIGLGSPWTMQVAINEVGLPRVLFAALASFVTKPFGIKGVFYRLVGQEVASIDGPTEYSLYPSNVSAKLGPRDPEGVAKEIDFAIREAISFDSIQTFEGAVVIDANDLGQTVLGNSTPFGKEEVVSIFGDNPMGQTREQTPIVMVFSV